MFIPQDNKKLTEKYAIEHGGICGQACLAVITRNSIQSVLDLWKYQGLEFKGWSGWKQLRQYLEYRGYKVKQIRGTMHYDSKKFYIARVQWLGDGDKKDKPFYGWNHWSQATSYTHFIVIERFKFFCNETGWGDFPTGLKKYLEANHGVITSYMEITPQQCANCGLNHMPNTKCSMQPESGTWSFRPMESGNHG